MEEIFKEKIKEGGLDFENLSEESKKVFNIVVASIPKFMSDRGFPGIVFPIQCSTDEIWVRNAVQTTLFSLMLRGRFKTVARSREVDVLTLYIMSGLGENTKNARESVRRVLQIEEKCLNSLNLQLRKKGLLISNPMKTSDYTFCKELEIIHQYYNRNKSLGTNDMSFGIKLIS